MSRLDVLKSLLRSTARSAGAGVRGLPLSTALQRVLSEVSPVRIAIGDAQLTRAVARLPGMVAATVSSGRGKLRVDASFDDGKRLAMTLAPAGMAFAPGGAKELSFAVEPEQSALEPRGQEVMAAIATEIARGLWRTALARAPRSEPGSVVVSREHATLFVDLRGVPEVRWALRQRLPAALIEALHPRALEIREGRLVLTLALDRVF